jgi:hypothetical protein
MLGESIFGLPVNNFVMQFDNMWQLKVHYKLLTFHFEGGLNLGQKDLAHCNTKYFYNN